MSKRIQNSIGGGARRLTSPSRQGHLQLHGGPLLGLAASLAPCGFAAMAQEPPKAGTLHSSEQTILKTRNRVVFDKEALFSGAIPYWNEGYLITRTIESFSAATRNVVLFRRDGSKSAEVAFWFPGSQRVAITSAAVSHYGGILASGEADKVDGTRALFIALANLEGQLTNVIQTGDFYPKNVCEAPDRSIWAFGGMTWDTSRGEPSPGNVLRRFDLQKGETASYVPRSTFPPKIQADALSHIRCSGDAVVIYSNPAKVLIKFPYKAEAPRIYHISAPEGLEVVGFAVTNSGDVYGSLENLDRGSTGKEGMYTLLLNRGTDTGHWQPVKGAVGDWSNEGVVSRVWGVDGDSLVVSRGNDPAEITALHWVTISPR